MGKSSACNMIGEPHRLTHCGSRWTLHSNTAQIPACWTTKHCPHRSTTILTGIAYSDFQSGTTRKSSIPHFSSSPSPGLEAHVAFHLGRVFYFSPHSPLLLTSPSLCFWPECYHLLTDNNLLWIFIHSFEMLMRLFCFPPSPKLGTFHTLIPWSAWREKHSEAVYQFV